MAAVFKKPPIIQSYKLGRVLGRGAASVVYRAEREGLSYAVKVLESQDVESGLRFRQEASALATLNHPGLVRVIETGETEGDSPRSYIVMEFVEGETLAAQLDTSKTISEAQTVALAKELTEALAEVHRHGLVHKDIKPSNIVVTHRGQAKIIDFGFAGRAQADDEGPTDQVVGTFLYAPPEQTGMLRRPIDGRSDLYALGCLLYECSTGRPPFQSESVAELLQQHAAVRPDPICTLNPRIGRVFSRIVDKLLSKDPDDRYQSAKSLLSDLDRMSAFESELNDGGELSLGKKDSQIRLSLGVPMFGRDTELECLSAAWNRAKTGHGSVVLIEGEPGMGKTRLAMEMLAQAEEQGALVLLGKSQQAERAPLGAFREALDASLARTERWSEVERLAYLDMVRRAAGSMAGVVRRLSPALKDLLGDALDIPPLVRSDEEQQRFYECIAAFFVDLARESKALVLMIDDVQWMDSGTGEVLAKMIEMAMDAPLLILATARTESKSDDSKQAFIELVRQTTIERVSLRPLTEEVVAQYITAQLGGRDLDEEIINLLATRSGGNPFALGEYLRSLLEHGMIRPTSDGWGVVGDIDDVELPSEVIQVLIDRMNTLGEEANAVLETAAVAGFSFKMPLIVSAMGWDGRLVQHGLELAQRASLVKFIGDNRWQFVHDRVPEALLAGMDAEHLRSINQSLADALDDPDDGDPNTILALARYCSSGYVEENFQRVFETSFAAGKLALESHSNLTGLELLERASETASSFDVETAHKEELEELLGEACTRTGRIDEGHRHFGVALETAKDPEFRARVHSLRSHAYSIEGRHQRAWAELRKALLVYRIRFPSTRPFQIIYALFFWGVVGIYLRTRLGYGHARGEKRLRQERIARLLERASIVGYFLEDPFIMVLVLLRFLTVTHSLGDHALTARAYSTYGAFNIMGLGRARVARRLGRRGLEMARQTGDVESIGMCGLYDAVCIAMSGNTHKGVERLNEALPDAIRVCANHDWMLLMTTPAVSLFIQGKVREAAPFWREAALYSERYGASPDTLMRRHYRATCLSMQGIVENDREECRERALAESGSFYQSMAHGLEVAALAESGELGQEIEEHYREYLKTCQDNGATQVFHLWMGYARVEGVRRARGESLRKEALKALKKHIRKIQLPPVNAGLYPLYKSHILIMRAALARELEGYRKSSLLLDRAEKLAHDVDSVWALWAIHRERARLYGVRGEEDGARSEATKALSIALEQGWGNRIKEAREEFDLEEPEIEEAGSRPDSRDTSSADALTTERYMDALLEVALASSSLEPEEQYREALDALLKVLGGERAFLFLTHDDDVLEMRAGRDPESNDLLPLTGFSSTIVRKVHESGELMIVTGKEEGEAIGSESAVTYELRSIMAAPLFLRGRKMGVVYVDSRMAKGLFTQEHVDIFRAIATHLAIAVEMASQARRQNAKLEQTVEARTRELRELNDSLQREVQAKSLRLLPPRVAKFLLDGEELLDRQRRCVTAFHLELKGFERVAEQVKTKELSSMLNSYLTEITDVALEHGATLSGFRRDAVSGIFGAPLSDGEALDALHGAETSLELWKRAVDVCKKWGDLLEYEPPRPTMVLSTGMSIVGSFGSPQHMEYTAICGPVDEARHLVSKLPAGQLVCTASTYAHLEGKYESESFHPTGSELTLHRLAGDPKDETLVRVKEIAREPGYEALIKSETLELPVLKVGSIVGGRYELESKLGEGGMGTVFQAHDRKLNEKVALKLIRADLRDESDVVERLRREVKLARLVSHRNVARIYDLGDWAGGDLISMEFVKGQTLSRILKNGLLPVEQALNILRQLCSGLSAAHAAGVVHRDLKPSNIMIEPTGRAVILDFGVSTWVSRRSGSDSSGTVGTPHYMAPEQFSGKRSTASTDIYSLGVVAFELLTGSLPFEAESVVALAVKHSEEAPPDPLELRSEISLKIAAVILRCLEKRPRDRFESPDSVRQLLI